MPTTWSQSGVFVTSYECLDVLSVKRVDLIERLRNGMTLAALPRSKSVPFEGPCHLIGGLG